MERVRLGILGGTTVLAWVALLRIFPESVWDFGVMPPPWWKLVVTSACLIVLAYPLAHALGISERRYARGALVAFGLAALIDLLAPAAGREWLTLAILAIAFTGWVLSRTRQHRDTHP
jgi:hypothetical protein